ncbi:MAG: response regulator, partial [Gammaproteobacteria bacterium]|nr:response regulator [Gammaproteobacteria bacterium]
MHIPVQRDHIEILRSLRTHLDAIQSRVRGHNASGWRQDVLHSLSNETTTLQGTAARVAPEWADAFGPLLVALRTATAAPHPPTPATGSELLAATGRALRLLPTLPESASQAPGAGADVAPRAEYPPAHFWRRWCEDAPEAEFPDPASTQGGPAQAATEIPGNDPDESPYRVLVVEDDRSQALFAQGVLSGAGMQAEVVSIPGEVMQAMAGFSPDLVLMDLHMPGISGTELTGMIRADPAFAHTPIVFLTGDPDPERQYEVLESGADDFLSKPIRPRHLIAAVHSRIKRVRAQQRQRGDQAVRHPLTGLYNRPYLLQRLADALAAAASGGALFVEIQNTAALHDRYGYAGFEQLMHDAGQRIGELAGACPSARLNDNAFLAFVPDGGQAQLETLARSLRDGVSH